MIHIIRKMDFINRHPALLRKKHLHIFRRPLIPSFRFLIRAFYVTVVYSLGVDALAIFLPAGVTRDLLLNALYGGIVGGIGHGLIYRGGTSAAGTSI